MKKVFQVTLAAALMIGAVSCGPQEEKKVVDAEATEVVEETAEPIAKMEVLSLNGREKWPVNNEMKEYPLNCKKAVDSYISEQKTDYIALADQLGGQNKKLISACTMDGQSHDALHLWLEPNLALVADLSKASNADEASSIVQKLNDSYTLYDRFFE